MESNREDADYIMDTFPIVRRKDKAKFGEYRTNRVILEIPTPCPPPSAPATPTRLPLDPPPGPPEGGFPDWACRRTKTRKLAFPHSSPSGQFWE